MLFGFSLLYFKYKAVCRVILYRQVLTVPWLLAFHQQEWDRWIVVEITQEKSLEKVRMDIAKLFTVKNYLLAQDIYCQCYYVMQDKPTDSMRQFGEAQKVKVMSGIEFQNECLFCTFCCRSIERKKPI